MAITSQQVKVLREKTGGGMMDCKRALEEAGGDMEKAIEYLRKKGAATAQKRAGKSAKEGLIVTRLSDDRKRGIIVEVNCETDFVARGKDFTEFADAVAQVIDEQRPQSVEQLLSLQAPAGPSVSELLNELLAKVGEKVDIRRFEVVETSDGIVGAYTHMGNKIGVLVEVAGVGASQDGVALSRDLAMQIAAMSPLYITKEDVPHDTIERELEIYRTQAKNEGKPAQVLDRIAAGRLEKFYQEVCLAEQTFIKDSGRTIRELLGESLTIRRFVRLQLGESQD